ncbi:hypothetical protein EON65_00935 [archaeon]|nr:MAG: hypothetical protein EON65_00935 [archaeon]
MQLETMSLCGKSRVKYMSTVRQKIINTVMHEQDGKAEEEKLRGFDETLPVTALIVFRETAAKEAALEIQKMRQAATVKQKAEDAKSVVGYVSSWFSAKPHQASNTPTSKLSEEEEDKRLMAELEANFNTLNAQAESAINQAFSFRARLISSAVLSLSDDSRDFAELDIGADFSMETRYSNISMLFAMKQLAIHDKLSENPYNPDILSFIVGSQGLVSSPKSPKPPKKQADVPCLLEMSIRPEVVNIKYTSRPIVITWNEQCIRQIFTFIVSGSVADPINLPAGSRLKSSLESFGPELPKTDVNISIDLEAPKLIIPELRGSDQCIITDMGKLSVQGSMKAGGMAWDVHLSRINIAMPMERPNLGLIAGQEAAENYLIQPFDVEVYVKSETSNPETDTMVNVQVYPSIQGHLDAVKVARLLKALFVVLDSVAVAEQKSQERVKMYHPEIKAASPQPQRRRGVYMQQIAVPKDESKPKVKVAVSLELLRMTLNIEHDHYAVLSLESFTLELLQHTHDMCLTFHLKSIGLQDSLRPAMFADVISCRTGESSESDSFLITGKYVAMTNPASRYYTEFQNEFDMKVAAIHIYVDAVSTGTYQSLARQLISSVVEYKVFDRQNPNDLSSAPASVEEYSMSLGGMKIEFAMRQVTVNLLAFDPSTKGFKKDLNYFEQAYSLQLNSLYFISIMREKTNLRAELSAVDILDVRSKSSSNCYKQLIGDEFHQISGEKEEKLTKPMIEMEMHEEEDGSNNLQLTLRNITLMVTAEVVVHIMGVAMENVNSVMAVLGELTAGESDASEGQTQENLPSPSMRKPSRYDAKPKSSKMVLLVSMEEPRLMMLADVKSKHSKAIVNRSNVFVQLVMTTSDDDEITDLSLVLHSSEIFVVTDVVGFKRYHQLLKPMGLNFHMKSLVVQKKQLQLEFNIGVESVKFRASLNDLVLIADIIQGQQFDTDANFDEAIESSNAENQILERRGSVYKNEQDVNPIYKIKSVISFVEIVLINDYHGQNIPCFKFSAKDADFYADGVTNNLQGAGRVFLAANYYNLPLAVWEPMLEEWAPKLTVVHDFNGLQLKADCDDPMQINVTGELCNCVANALQLMQNIGVNEAVASSDMRAPLSIVNQLGIPVEILDSRNDNTLAALFDYNVGFAINTLYSGSSSPVSEENLAHVPTFTLRLLGDVGEKFAEIRHLPHSFMKSKVYQLQPQKLRSVNTGQDALPVVEEAYQYSRFNPAKMKWEAPWPQLNDPPEWSDVLGRSHRDPRVILLPHGWKWLEPDWRVDTSGVSSKETDEEGWDYSVSFQTFTVGSKRRNKLPTDCVRRRRLFRTRVMDETQAKTTRVLTSGLIVWNVELHADETKEIKIMTTKQITNHLSFGIEVGIEDEGCIVHSFEVSCNNTCSIPLLYCSGNTVLRIRPLSLISDWSERLDFDVAMARAETVRHIHCMTSDNKGLNLLWRLENDQVLRAILSAPIRLCNRLPCKVHWSIQPSDQTSPRERFDVNSGADADVLFTNYRSDVQVRVVVGRYESTFSLGGSAPQAEYKDIKVSFHNMHQEQSKSIILTLRVMQDPKSATLLFTIYADCLVVDKRFASFSRPNTEDIQNLGDCWTDLGSGLSLVEPREGKISFPTSDTKSTMESIQIESLSKGKSNVELSDLQSSIKYHVTLKMDRFSLAPDLCKVITVMHSYHVVNCMEKPIFLYQKSAGAGGRKEFTVPGRACLPWVANSESGDTNVFLRCEGSQVSYGCIDVNSIGTSVLFLPSSSEGDTSYVAANIEVRFSQPDEPSYVTVIVWEAKITKDPRSGLYHASSAINLLIKNELELPVAFRQSAVDFSKIKGSISKFSAVAQPGERKPFAWIDPEMGNLVDIFLYMFSDIQPVLTIDSSKVGKEELLRAPDGTKLGKVKIKAYSSGTVICLEPEYGKATVQSSVSSTMQPRTGDIQIKLSCGIIGLSIIAERPTRRELLSVHLNDLDFSLYQLAASHPEDASSTIIEFSVLDVQIDNYSESALYPVLLQQTKKSKKMSEKALEKAGSPKGSASSDASFDSSSASSFVQFSLALEKPPDQNTSVMKYVAFRLLEAQVQIDSASILIVLSDLVKDMMNLHSNLQLGEYSLELQAQNFNNSAAAPLLQNSLYDLEKQYKLSYGNKMFYEHIVIHPIKLIVSFSPSHYPRPASDIPPALKWMLVVESISGFEDMAVKVKSFIAKNALESPDSLSTRIVNKIVRDMQANLLGLAGNLIGSLSILGKPAGLYKNIGGGVQDFFYEVTFACLMLFNILFLHVSCYLQPYTGLMESPLSFAKGVTKGTGSLLKGVTTGVVSSTANVVGTATGGVTSLAKGVAKLSGDQKYIKQREEKKREFQTARGGIFSGFKAGTGSLVTGFASGISGLVTKPLEQGQKEGALGFIKGVGQGLVGVAVKPVMGVTEGISNVAMGINHHFSESLSGQHFRPPRAMIRRDVEDADLVLGRLNMFDARAQAFLNNRALSKNYKDTFLTAFTLGFGVSKVENAQAYGVAISTKVFAVLNKECDAIWMIPVPSISHISLAKINDTFGLEISDYEQKLSPSQRYLMCASKSNAIQVYSEAYRFRSIFGNPAAMYSPADSLLHLQALNPDSSSSQSTAHSDHSASNSPRALASVRKQSSIQTYKFGTANSSKVPVSRLNEQGVINKTCEKMSSLAVKPPVTIPDQVYFFHKLLDEIAWELVNNWNSNHDMIINPSRCLVMVIINHSHAPVRITDVSLKEGAYTVIMGAAGGYDSKFMTLTPAGGAALLFAYGKRPSLISKEHVKVSVSSTAFTCMVATRENRSECSSLAGFSPSFLEKTRNDWWAKYVLSIS